MAVLYASSSRKRKGTFRVKACQSLDSLRVTFDDPNAVANAGLVLTATTAQRLGLLEAAHESIHLDGLNRPGSDGGSFYWFPTPVGQVCWAS